MAKIFSLGICVLLLVSLLAWPAPVSAGISEWSTETIPTRTDTENILGPPHVDIRDLAIGKDNLTIYAAPGDKVNYGSPPNYYIFKSTDGGATWETIKTDIRADYVAVAPDDNNWVAIANDSSARVDYSNSAILSWNKLLIQAPGVTPLKTMSDLKISPLRNYNNSHYIVVTGEDTANAANLWYISSGVNFHSWYDTKKESGYIPDNETATMAFSPHFATDSIIFTITDDGTGSATTKKVKLQICKLSIGSDNCTWNNAAGFADFPHIMVEDTNLSGLASASLAISPGSFNANDSSTFQILMGLTINGAAAKSGIYRLNDSANSSIQTNIKIHSLALDSDGVRFIAGAYDSTTVYYCSNPFATTPTIYTYSNDVTHKCPGGERNTVVAWLGDSVVAAGTSGDESAFALSFNYGKTFNDISLIDTSILSAKDVAVSTDGSEIYLVSENNSNTSTSVWRYNDTWQRVYSKMNSTGFTVHVSPVDSSIVYLAQKGTKTILYNNESGDGPWNSSGWNYNIQDMAVPDDDTIYVIGSSGEVAKSTTHGSTWDTTVASSANLTDGYSITSVNSKIVLAGSTDGFVSYTLNGGKTWARIPQIIEPGARNIQVVADAVFSVNHVIYAASDKPGGSIMRWIIGTSDTWTDIFDGTIPGGIYGLSTAKNVLYAMEYDGIKSTLWRLLSPTTAEEGFTEWVSLSTSIGVQLNATPQALRASTDKLWAVNTDTSIGDDKLYSFTDTIINARIALLLPENGYLVPVNTISCKAYDVYFAWQRPSVATCYELLISADPSFNYNLASIPVNMSNDPAHVIVGPNQIDPDFYVAFVPEVTYYWKVRITRPGYSLYSATRSFHIANYPPSAVDTIILVTTNMTLGANPTLSWLPSQQISKYELRLGTDPSMKAPLIDTIVASTAYQVETALDYGETYFWQVREIEPSRGFWSRMGVFNVIYQPTGTPPSLIIEEAPGSVSKLTLTAPPATEYSLSFLQTIVTPSYLHVIFLFLLIALGVIIFMLRSQSFKLSMFRLRREPPVTPHKITPPGGAPNRPQLRPESRVDISKTAATPEVKVPHVEIPPKPAAPEKITPHPSLLEKDKEDATVIFAAKSFTWMADEYKKSGRQNVQTEKEQRTLGKKLAMKIHDLTRKENIYLKYPEDAPMLLSLWAEYASRNETSNYLTKSFQLNPYNAIKLIKCYLPKAQPDKPPPTAEDFTRAEYARVAAVIDPDNVYAALTNVFKFKAETIEERVPVMPADRNLAFQFMRLHHEIKGTG